MLGKDDELLSLPISAEHLFIILKEPGQLIPFPVNAADADLICHLLQSFQRSDFCLQLRNGGSGGSMVNDLLFDMTRVKLLVEISTDEKGEDSSYLPAEDLQRLSVGTLLERLDAEGKWTVDLDWKQMDSNTWEQSKQLYEQYIEGQRQLLLKDICMNNQQSES